MIKEAFLRGLSKLDNLTFVPMLFVAKSKALEAGYGVTFEGEYSQAPKGQPKTQFRTPFVVAQTHSQKVQLLNGLLECRVYEVGQHANVNGSIDMDSVIFEKIYDERSVENPERQRKVLARMKKFTEAMGGHSSVDPGRLVNPNIITYRGQRIKREELCAVTYGGRWSFNPDNSNKRGMALEGAFEMSIVDPELLAEFLG